MSSLAPQYHQTLEGIWHEGADSATVIYKAIKNYDHSRISLPDHFSQVGKMVSLGSGAYQKTHDYHLSRTHFEVGRKVRKKIIKEIGGTVPEELPTLETSVNMLERRRGKKAIKKSEGNG